MSTPATPGRPRGIRTTGLARDLTLPDQSGAPWRLADHRDAAALLVFYRGDW